MLIPIVKPEFIEYSYDDAPLKLKSAIRWGREILYYQIMEEFLASSEGAPNYFRCDNPPFWIAGGALRCFFEKTQPKDIDVYSASHGVYVALWNTVKKSKLFSYTISNSNGIKAKGQRIAISTNSLPIYSPWEVNSLPRMQDAVFENVSYFYDFLGDQYNYGSPSNCIANFDFTVAACAISPNKIVFHKDYFEDLAAKRLRFINYQGTIPALARVNKYQRKGFITSLPHLSKYPSYNLLLRLNNSFYKVEDVEILTSYFVQTDCVLIGNITINKKPIYGEGNLIKDVKPSIPHDSWSCMMIPTLFSPVLSSTLDEIRKVQIYLCDGFYTNEYGNIKQSSTWIGDTRETSSPTCSFGFSSQDIGGLSLECTVREKMQYASIMNLLKGNSEWLSG